MLINLNHFLKAHYVQPKGVIHVGAHYGQEYDHYIECGMQRIIFIEPLKKAYQVLQNRFNGVPDVEIWNFACGRKPEELEMYVEDDNQGQSSSLMKPKEHLKQYPGIRFRGREPVKVFPLDFLSTIGCNILMIDTQGFELEVLRGAKETLRNIDVVYSEVNRAEMYEGCPMIEDLDEYLRQFDFERKEAVWYANGNWGDAVYLKRKPL